MASQSDSTRSRLVIELEPDRLEPSELAARLDFSECGSVVSFTGLTRGIEEGAVVEHLEFDIWPEKLIQVLTELAQQCIEKFGVSAVGIAHRSGIVHPGQPIVSIHVGSRHRAEGFKACEWLIDELKSQAPVWKKEVRADGEHWKSGLG